MQLLNNIYPFNKLLWVRVGINRNYSAVCESSNYRSSVFSFHILYGILEGLAGRTINQNPIYFFANVAFDINTYTKRDLILTDIPSFKILCPHIQMEENKGPFSVFKNTR